MKNLFGILCAACGVMLMPACTSDDIESDFQGALDEAGMTEVTLSLGGDYVEVYDSPLTRAEVKKKLYGVNVYYSGLEEINSKNEHIYHMYAYGLFDDPTKMKIKLSDKFVYLFQCSVVKDDRNELMYYYTKNGNTPFYSYPFAKIDKFVTAQEKYTEKDPTNVNLINKTLNKNAFTYSTTDNLTEIVSGKAYVQFIDNRIDKVTQAEANMYSTNFYKHDSPTHSFASDSIRYNLLNIPAVDRWFGQLGEFSTESSTTAILPLHRTAFGLKFVVTPPADGKVLVHAVEVDEKDNSKELNEICKIDVLAKNGKTTPQTIESLYSFDKVKECYEKLIKDKKESTKFIKVTFSLEHANEFKPNISKVVKVTRNKMTTLEFDAEKILDSSFAVTEDDVIEPDTTIIVK